MLPPNVKVDIHDLAAILLDCHQRSESRFATFQLAEITRETIPPSTLPPSVIPYHYHAIEQGQRRVVYILKGTPNSRFDIDTFAVPDGVKLPAGSSELKRKELEDVYWRCKDFDSGYHLSYAMQRVLDALPATAQLVVRTSTGYALTCAPSDVTVPEIEVLPKEAALIVKYTPRPDLGPTKVGMEQHLSGFEGPMPWVFLLIGKPPAEVTDMEEDPRVVLDLALPQIGGRGAGGELFALERGADYHDKVLARVAQEGGEYKLSGKIQISPSELRAQGDALAEMVLGRLEKHAMEDDVPSFCRYCGKDDVDTRCSKCKKARFCRDCQALGWKYHKKWCI